MISFLTKDQKIHYEEFKEFIKTNVEPNAAKWDYNQEIPNEFISQYAKTGYLGSNIPKEFGGKGWDYVTFGLLNEAIGRGISSLTDLLTIQAMVSTTLIKWGTPKQKSKWLNPLAKGEVIGAYALTEPNVGSSLKSLETKFIRQGDKYILSGSKKWTSFGEKADLFLVFGFDGEKSISCLLPKDTPGLEIIPIKNMMGFKAAHMAQLNFYNIEISKDDMIGKPGFALSYVAPIGLHYGRISTSCSALGLLRACFEESIMYSAQRKIGNKFVGAEGMIQTLIAQMGTNLNAASLLCYSACKAEDEKTPDVYEKVQMAKYFTSKAVVNAASDAVQIHGANGCHESSNVARYYRDSKIMEIIEGTTQIHEKMLAKTFLDKASKLKTRVGN